MLADELKTHTSAEPASRHTGRVFVDPAPRPLIAFIDVENFTERGPAGLTVDELESIIDEVYRVGCLDDALIVVAAANPGLRSIAAQLKRPLVWRFRKHSSGADKALIREIGEPSRLAEVFGRVVIASGDGLFAWVVQELEDVGVETVVIARRNRCAKSLQKAAGSVQWTRSSPAQRSAQ